MRIKGMDGHEANVTSQGQGTLNTILGSIGTLGAIQNNNGCGGGLFGGILGGNGNGNGNGCVSEKEFAWAEKYNQCLANTARLEAENFTRAAATKAFEDSVTYSANLNDKQATNLKELYGIVITQGTQIAKLQQDAACEKLLAEKNQEITNLRIDAVASASKCSVDNLAVWTQNQLAQKVGYSNYIDGSQVFCPDSSICSGSAATFCGSKTAKV